MDYYYKKKDTVRNTTYEFCQDYKESEINKIFLKILKDIKEIDPASLADHEIDTFTNYCPSAAFLGHFIKAIDSDASVTVLLHFIDNHSISLEAHEQSDLREKIITRMSDVCKSTRSGLANCFAVSLKFGGSDCFDLLYSLIGGECMKLQLCSLICVLKMTRNCTDDVIRALQMRVVEVILPIALSPIDVYSDVSCGLYRCYLKIYILILKDSSMSDYVSKETCSKMAAVSYGVIEKSLKLPIVEGEGNNISLEIWPCRKWALRVLFCLYFRFYTQGWGLIPRDDESVFSHWKNEHFALRILKIFILVLKQSHLTHFKESDTVLQTVFMYINLAFHNAHITSDQAKPLIDWLSTLLKYSSKVKDYIVKFICVNADARKIIDSSKTLDVKNKTDMYILQMFLHIKSSDSAGSSKRFNSDIRNNFPADILPAKVVYIFDEELILSCDRLPSYKKRASMIFELIRSYGLLDKLTVMPSVKIVKEELCQFHDPDYVAHIENLEWNEHCTPSSADAAFGLEYDCAPFEDLYNVVLNLAGASITAADLLIRGQAQVAINWCGGWHHTLISQASGFCYVNDIVLAIEKLKARFEKILYLDLDVHHGDAVESIYKNSKRVLTMSFHKYETGFFPQSGNITDIGGGTGLGYCINFPFRSNYSDDSLLYAFQRIWPRVIELYQPEAIVVQCGADVLSMDPVGGANVSPEGLSACLKNVLSYQRPILLLGGGGYNFANTARCWTYLTSCITGVELDEFIPENYYFSDFGPDYTLKVPKSAIRDRNDEIYLQEAVDIILSPCAELESPI